MFLRFLTEKLVLDAEEPKEIPTSLIFLTTVSSEKRNEGINMLSTLIIRDLQILAGFKLRCSLNRVLVC